MSVLPPGWESLWYPRAPEDLARKIAMAPLAAASVAFGVAVRTRNALYERGWLARQRVDGVRVVSVGNLTVGGAGKTPVVIHLAQRLVDAGQSVGVLSRGYGRSSKATLRVQSDTPVAEAGDEPLLVARRCVGAAVWVGSDRVDLARRARDAGARILILDDGMQHRRLERDVEIVVVDAAAAYGNGWMLPRGPLREPPSALSRATLVWIRESGSEPSAAVRPAAATHAPAVHALHSAVSVASDGTERPVESLKGRRVFALAGIARPERFRQTLLAAGADVVGAAFFRDHHLFRPDELAQVQSQARSLAAEVITTEKDAVRLPVGVAASVVRLGVQILAGEAELVHCLGLG